MYNEHCALIDEKPMIPFLILLLPKTYKEKTWIFFWPKSLVYPFKKIFIF